MKKTLAMVTFAVAGAGALGVGATLNFNGSDTLGDFTHELISTTNAAGTTVANTPFCTMLNGSTYTAPDGGNYNAITQLNYLGGGSGSGENQMSKGAQAIAPMSREMSTTACGGPAGGAVSEDAGFSKTGLPANATNANGIVVALDGLSILASGSTGGSAACNGNNTDLSCAGEPAFGLAYNKTVTLSDGSSYTFGGWGDILSVLYFGVVSTNYGHATTVKDCNSVVRQTLAANWGDLFETPNCQTGTCTQLQHIWRRDDASGTSDIFAALLGGSPSPAFNKNKTGANVGWSGGNYYIGADPFCNDMENTSGVFTQTWQGSNPPGVNSAQTLTGIVPNDMQDYDPIRRTCAGNGSRQFGTTAKPNPTEQVCERGTFDAANTQITGSGATATFACGATGNGVCPTGESCLGGQCWGPGSLGLLLPIDTANTLAVPNGTTVANLQYDLTSSNSVNLCTGGAVFVLPPQIKKPTVGTESGLCPNGDIGTGGFCVVPADPTGNPNCFSFKTDGAPALAACTSQGSYDGQSCSGAGPNPQLVDPRVFNLYAYVLNSSGTAYQAALDDSGRPMVGAYYRIHTSQDMLVPNNAPTPSGGTVGTYAVCANQDATDQIGCLVQASPCSLGYAGRAAENANNNPHLNGLTPAGALGLRLRGGVPDAVQCIQTFEYPFSRKLYLNTIPGFQNASAPEQALAYCENTSALVNQAVAQNNFIPLPGAGLTLADGGTSPNGQINAGNPFCEDFNEQMLCADAGQGAGVANVNACNNNAALGIALNQAGTGVASTVCGNGVVEAFEDCDDGLSNGTAGDNCSTICRFVH